MSAALQALNRAFPDSLLLVGRVLGGRPSATAARAVALDAGGVELSIEDVDGVHAVRLDFDAALTSDQFVGPAVLGLVERARRQSGEAGQTSGERELVRLRMVRTFETAVRAVSDVHPYLRRITLGGGDLATFAPLGPDTFVYLMPSVDGEAMTWSGWASPTDRPAGAYYTVRSWRPAASELDVLVVLHDGPGVVSSWAEHAEPGHAVTLWGPRDGFEPPVDAGWYLVVADDTGLPAAGAILEQLPSGTAAFVVAEVDGPATRPPLPDRVGVEVSWVYRCGRPAGTTPDLLADAVRSVRLPAGPGYVWGGAERAAIAAVRNYVRADLGLPGDRQSLVGYWDARR